MNATQLRCAAALGLMLAGACSQNGQNSTPDGAVPDLGAGDQAGSSTVDVRGEITASTTWIAARTYVLKSHVFVRGTEGSPTVLTIEPGTQILGDQGSSLVITQTARIQASGTAAQPIVFTSSRTVGSRRPGDWGGVILLGRAPVNDDTTLRIEGFPDTETRTVYGGTDAAHSCGTLRYARIEFAGFELQPNRELNGLTVGACGSQTVIDYVQVHRGSDDGIEMFGGTADLRHVVVSQVDDDGIDWDYGWRGRMQFAVVQQSPNAGDNGIEADNHPDPSHTNTPVANPLLYNVTLVGSNAAIQGQPGAAFRRQVGILFRRGTAARVHNLIMAYFADFPIDVTNEATVANTAAPASLYVRNSVFFDNGNQDSWDDPADAREGTGGFNEGNYFRAEASNQVGVDPQLTAALDLTAPDFTPRAGSPALVAASAATPPTDGFFDTSAAYVGAVGTSNWLAGWTAFPNN